MKRLRVVGNFSISVRACVMRPGAALGIIVNLPRCSMNIFRKYHLKTGLLLAAIFPAIFAFDNWGGSVFQSLLFFFNIFFFIFFLWLVNAVLVDFRKLLRPASGRQKLAVYRNMVFSLLLSVPVYILLALLFRQEQVLMKTVLAEPGSAKAWFYLVLRIMMFDAGLLLTRLVIDNNREKQLIRLENEMLKTEQLKATHETFKQQVDPHFLFNSLNTLQSLVKQEDSQRSLQFIRELSNVYRYMLIQRQQDYVSLSEEVEFLKSYLYLLNIRFQDAFAASFAIEEGHLTSKIPVHTLQLLAENAVKHNRVTRQEPLLLEIRSGHDQLIVSNNLLPKRQWLDSSGIGLNNINARYKLLFGREIAIESDDKYFRVCLPVIH